MSKFNRIKDLSVAVSGLAEDTGEDYDILCHRIQNLVENHGATYEKAYEFVKRSAYSMRRYRDDPSHI